LLRRSAPRNDGGRRAWTINGDFVALRPNGVARYATEVVRALDALVAEGHPLTAGLDLRLVAPRPTDAFAPHAIDIDVLPEFRTPRLPQFWVQAQLPRHVRGGLLSLCNLAPVAVRRHIACIHDVQTRLTPESYGRGFRLAHRLVLPALGRRAAAITTVSAFSRDRIVALGIAPAAKVTIAPDGADHALRWDGGGLRKPPPGERPYVLALGACEAHKNMALLARLAAPLDALGLDLRLAGAIDRAAFPADAANVHFLGRVGDDRLARLLGGALGFLLPSRTEGFGLPAAEAMALGCPVLAAAAGALPEICGQAALLLPPDNDAAWIAAVRRLRDQPALRARLAAAGRLRAAAFSWRRTAETYLRLMAQIDGIAAPSPAAVPATAAAE
jgi:glycosyltransferase involved in cell wall biosynthesis